MRSSEQKSAKHLTLIFSTLYYSMTPKIYKHGGDWGDAILFLPNLKYAWGSSLIFCPFKGKASPRQVCTPEVAAKIIPLIEIQPYVRECRYWSIEDENNTNIIDGNIWRNSKEWKTHLCHSQLIVQGTPLEIADEPWLTVTPKKIAPIVINRTNRYHGTLDYRKCGLSAAVFLGHKDEHKRFCDQFGNVSYYETKDWLEAAQVIAGAELFVGNQSCCYAIAEAMKKPLVQEVYEKISNNFFNRTNVIYCRGENFDHLSIFPLMCNALRTFKYD